MSKATTRFHTRSQTQEGEPGPHFRLPVTGPSRDDPAVLLSTCSVYKSFRKGMVSIPVLRGVDFAAAKGQITAVVGQSGSGKSTLLHLLATLDAPDSGQIHFEKNRIDNLCAGGRDTLRNQYFGMIFQFYHLLPELTTLENVLLPGMIRFGVCTYLMRKSQLRDEAIRLLELVGLTHRLRHRPSELSGGEMQRVAIARALISRPRVLLADEPTGNLDEQTGGQIMQLLRSLNDQHKLTIVMVTHDVSIARQADRIAHLVDGRIAEVE
jgi:lipoprotein-releasing system ATP-binding protein